MLILDRFILKIWLSYFLLITVGLIATVFIFDSLDSLARKPDLNRALTLGLQLIPPSIELITPFTVLIATLLTFSALHKHSEIVAIKLAGLSQFRIAQVILLFSALVAGLLYFNQSYLVRILNAEARSYGLSSKGRALNWYYVANRLIHVKEPLVVFNRIKEVEVIIFDFDNQLTANQLFTDVRRVDNSWRATKAEFVTRRGEKLHHEVMFDYNITDFNLSSLARSPVFPSIYQPLSELFESWQGSQLGEYVAEYSLLLLLRKIAYLIGIFILILLAVLFSEFQPRSQKGITQIISASLIYYFYWFLDQLFFVMAKEETVNIFWGAFGANILLVLYIGWFLKYRRI